MGPSCGAQWVECFNGVEQIEEQAGICLQGLDGELMANPDDPVGQCWVQCLGDAEVGTCLDECLTLSGFSDECADCAGDFGDCTMAHCPEECSLEAQTADGGEACGACMGMACGGEAAMCFHNPNEEAPPEPGVCAGWENTEAVAQPGDHIGWCYLMCLGQDDTGSCITSCLDSAGFSDECSDCAGDFGTCVQDNCGDVCTAEAQEADEGVACGECMGPSCGALWAECFAGIEEIEEEPGLCVNPNDQALDAAGGDSGFDYCWGMCMDEPDTYECASDCMLDGGYTDDCSDCMGELVECIQDNCTAECTPEAQAADGGEACWACFIPACYGPLAKCTTDPDSEPEPDPEPDIVCGGEGDQALMALEENIPWTCGWSCMGEDVDEVETCMYDCASAAGYSDGCSECLGDASVCVNAYCQDLCTEEAQLLDEGEACGECVTENCYDIWDNCFGFD
jgi:hypothetical protein